MTRLHQAQARRKTVLEIEFAKEIITSTHDTLPAVKPYARRYRIFFLQNSPYGERNLGNGLRVI